jgi:hexosaminidase
VKPLLIPYPKNIEFTGGAPLLPADAPVIFTHTPGLCEEAYVLKTGNGAVNVAASTEAGKFYAEQTLSQLRAAGGLREGLEIHDAPAYSYRGFMIDCCRHFYGVPELKRLIDAAARFKLNRFHWHLTDDQGWRIEIKKYPLLTEVGAKRSGSRFGGYNEGKPHEGFFTQDEVREIVNYCAARHIEVIPEIEMPGHFTAALAAYPFLGCTGEKMEPIQKEGIYPNVLCVGSDEAVAFMKDVLEEVCALFPGRYVHIGGDEAPRTRWQACEKCAAKMKRLGLADYDALQGSFIEEIASFLREKGRTAITWNESLKGGCLSPENVIVQRWMDRDNLCAGFTKRGGSVIESDFYHYYFDYPYGMTPLKKAFTYDPAGKTGAEGILGVEGALWTEYVRTFRDLTGKLFPRLLAVAERGWSGTPGRSYADFTAAVQALMPLLGEGVTPMLPPERWDPGVRKRLKEVTSFFKGPFSADTLRQLLENRQ